MKALALARHFDPARIAAFASLVSMAALAAFAWFATILAITWYALTRPLVPAPPAAAGTRAAMHVSAAAGGDAAAVDGYTNNRKPDANSRSPGASKARERPAGCATARTAASIPARRAARG